MGFTEFSNDFPCPNCSKTIRKYPLPAVRLQWKARLLLLMVIPVFLGSVAILLYISSTGVFGPNSGGVLRTAMLIIIFGPTSLIVWIAMSFPKVIHFRCLQCGWSEKQLTKRRRRLVDVVKDLAREVLGGK